MRVQASRREGARLEGQRGRGPTGTSLEGGNRRDWPDWFVPALVRGVLARQKRVLFPCRGFILEGEGAPHLTSLHFTLPLHLTFDPFSWPFILTLHLTSPPLFILSSGKRDRKIHHGERGGKGRGKKTNQNTERGLFPLVDPTSSLPILIPTPSHLLPIPVEVASFHARSGSYLPFPAVHPVAPSSSRYLSLDRAQKRCDKGLLKRAHPHLHSISSHLLSFPLSSSIPMSFERLLPYFALSSMACPLSPALPFPDLHGTWSLSWVHKRHALDVLPGYEEKYPELHCPLTAYGGGLSITSSESS